MIDLRPATSSEAYRAHGYGGWACAFVVVYSVSFKQPKGGSLRWHVAWEAKDAAAASREARDLCPAGCVEYGISREIMVLNPGPPRWLSIPRVTPADVLQMFRDLRADG